MDDLKLFVNDLSEIDSASYVIKRFEEVSGLEMHRDPRKQKCQVLPFGNHSHFNNWPAWVTVKEEVKLWGLCPQIKGNYSARK